MRGIESLPIGLLLFGLAFGFAGCGDSTAQPVDQPDDDEEEDEDKPAPVVVELGKLAAGQRWLVETTAEVNAAGIKKTSVVFTRIEVKEIKDNRVYYTQTELNENKEPLGRTVEFVYPGPSDDPVELNSARKGLTEETIDAAGHDFRCFVFESADVKMWTAVDYPILVVKTESTKTSMNLRSELVEFSDG